MITDPTHKWSHDFLALHENTYLLGFIILVEFGIAGPQSMQNTRVR